jgi:hypothetical protein
MTTLSARTSSAWGKNVVTGATFYNPLRNVYHIFALSHHIYSSKLSPGGLLSREAGDSSTT